LFNYLQTEVSNLKLVYDPYSDNTLNPLDKTLTDDINEASNDDWIYVKNIDFFNAVKTSYDYPIIIVPEFITSANTQNFRILNYSINIDYNPIYTHKESLALANSILNLWDMPLDGTRYCLIGTEFRLWDFFDDDPDSTLLENIGELKCIMFTKPSVKKTPTGQANYLRYVIDLSFLLLLNVDATLIGSCIQV